MAVSHPPPDHLVDLVAERFPRSTSRPGLNRSTGSGRARRACSDSDLIGRPHNVAKHAGALQQAGIVGSSTRAFCSWWKKGLGDA